MDVRGAKPVAMNAGWSLAVKFALIAFPVLIAIAALPRLVSGLAEEAVFPAEPYMQMNVPLVRRFYASTARILGDAPASDGDTQLWRAEALLRSGQTKAAADVARAALLRTPASARGWILLAAALSRSDPEKAANALALSLELAPREYFLIPVRVQVGAVLWRHLPQNAQDRLLEDVRWLAADERQRPALRALLAGKGGPALVTRALVDNPRELRALNRSLARERLQLH